MLVPFNPDDGEGKARHHIAGTVDGVRVRAIIEPVGDEFGFTLDPTSPNLRQHPAPARRGHRAPAPGACPRLPPENPFQRVTISDKR